MTNRKNLYGYALSEILVCGECGTPYKRCTWARNGKKRIVWRCVNRLEFGRKYCHSSPTLDEDRLHQAIVAALNEYGSIREEVAQGLGGWRRRPRTPARGMEKDCPSCGRSWTN